MIDVDKAVATAVRTGKVSIGADSTIQSAKTGKARMVIIASNCSQRMREDMQYYCRLSHIPVMIYKGSSKDLAAVCAKPFIVSALTIKEPGDSEILDLMEKTEPEESHGGTE